MNKDFKVELKVTYQLDGRTYNKIQVGKFKSLKTAYKNGSDKLNKELKDNSLIGVFYSILINNKETYKNLNGTICFR